MTNLGDSVVQHDQKKLLGNFTRLPNLFMKMYDALFTIVDYNIMQRYFLDDFDVVEAQINEALVPPETRKPISWT